MQEDRDTGAASLVPLAADFLPVSGLSLDFTHDRAWFPDSLAHCLLLFLPLLGTLDTSVVARLQVTSPVPPCVVLSHCKRNGAGSCTQEALQPCGCDFWAVRVLLSQISQSGGSSWSSPG